MANLKDTIVKPLSLFHAAVYRASGGRIGRSGFGMPVVILETTGRKTGKKRTTTLTSPVQDGDTVVLVASYGGDDRHPMWYLNLRDNPKVELTIHGKTQPMNARVATAAEKKDLWPRVVEAYKGYAQYQTRTERDIPLVLLEP
jgi:deazaflavin-dependent oxidoreductase (nitroreductase family)